MPKGDLFTIDPLSLSGALRASGGMSPEAEPSSEPESSLLDRFMEWQRGPKVADQLEQGGGILDRLLGIGGPDSSLLPMARWVDEHRQGPLDLPVGMGKEAAALALKVPLNLTRGIANLSSTIGADPNAEQYFDASNPQTLAAQIEKLYTGDNAPLALHGMMQNVGGAATDVGAAMLGDAAIGAALPGGALDVAPAWLQAALRGGRGEQALNWGARNIGGGALYGQLLENKPEEGAVAGGVIGAGLSSLAPVARGISRTVSPYLESAAEKSLGRVIAPGKEAWKKFVGKNASEIIESVPLRAASPFAEGGGLKGIEAFAQAQADTLKADLDALYRARTQPDVSGKLKSIRDRIRSTADGLLTAYGRGTLELAPTTRQTLEDIRASLASGRGRLNPRDTNIGSVQAAYDALTGALGEIRPEMRRRLAQARPATAAGQTISQALAGGADRTAIQSVRGTMDAINDLLTQDLIGTRTETAPIARSIDALRSQFGTTNAAGQFVSSHPAFTDAIERLADTVRAYGPEINANQLRGLANDWGNIVAGAKGTGFLTSIADESTRGALKVARGAVETARDTLMGPAVRDKSNELSFWLRLGDAAKDTVERRVGHSGGGLFGAMAGLAGLQTGTHYAHAAGAGLAGTIGAGAVVAAPAAMITVRVMKSPFWNLLSAKTKLSAANALRVGSFPAIQQAMRRILLELSLVDHGGLAALGHQDLTEHEANFEHEQMVQGTGPTPGVLDAVSPDEVYSPIQRGGEGFQPGTSIDPMLNQHYDQLQQQDLIDQTIGEQEADPESRQSVIDALSDEGPPQTAGFGAISDFIQKPLLRAPDLGKTHPHLQKLANLIAEQTSLLNGAFLGEAALRPLAAGTALAPAADIIGKGLASAMVAAGLSTGAEGVQEGRPGKVIGGGVQAALGGLGLRSGGLAGAAEEGLAALTPAARRVGGFASRVGEGLRAAGTQAVIGPAIGLSGQALADTDWAKQLIPDDETRNATFGAVAVAGGVGALGAVAARGMKGAREIPGVEGPVVVKRGPDFQTDGTYHVTFADGRTYPIYRDVSSPIKDWRVAGLEYAPISGFTKEELIQRLSTLDESGKNIDTHTGRVKGTLKEALDKERAQRNLPVLPAVADEVQGRVGAEPISEANELAPAQTLTRTEAVRALRDVLTDDQHAALVDEIKTAFPIKDQYTKPMHPMQPKWVLKKGEDLSPEAQAFLEAAVTGVDPKRGISPGELHAMAEGKEYAPKRLIREPLPDDYDYSKQIKGAPLGVQTRAHEQAALDNYLRLADNGQAGAKWYVRGGKAMLSHVGDDPAAARNLSALHSITSSATSIQVNSPFALKAWIQRMVGRPIKTGRYPKAMSKEAEKVFVGTSDIQQNLKRGAFYNETNEAGGFAEPGVVPRPTNDIWQSEAWGYANPDGTPHRSAVTPDMHAWMDRMTQEAVDIANQGGLGGRHDWTLGEMQAAAWTGIRNETLAAAGKKIPPYYDFGTGLETSYGQGGREPLPHKTTGHLKDLEKPENRAWLDRYDQLLYEATHDAQGRDLISLGVGALTGKSVRGPGEYEGVTGPGVQTRIATTPMKGEKLRGVKARPTELDTSSAELGKAAEAIYALHTGQHALAFGRFFPKGPVAGRNAYEVNLGRVPTEAEFLQLRAEMRKRGLRPDDTIAKVFGENGYVVKNLGRRGQRMGKIRDAIAAVHPDAEVAVGRHSGQFETNAWDVPGQEVGQRYHKMIPDAVMDRYEQFGPELQKRIDAKMAQFHKESGGQFLPAPLLQELHTAIRDQGPRAAFASLAAKYGVSVVMLSTLAGLMGWHRVRRDEEQAS